MKLYTADGKARTIRPDELLTIFRRTARGLEELTVRAYAIEPGDMLEIVGTWNKTTFHHGLAYSPVSRGDCSGARR